MGLSLSIEILIPLGVDIASVISIGARYCPLNSVEGMDIGEALEWAFTSSGGVAELSSLGITWNTIQTGDIR